MEALSTARDGVTEMEQTFRASVALVVDQTVCDM